MKNPYSLNTVYYDLLLNHDRINAKKTSVYSIRDRLNSLVLLVNKALGVHRVHEMSKTEINQTIFNKSIASIYEVLG